MSHTSRVSNDLNQGWVSYCAAPSPLFNIRVELTFKQRRNSDLVTVRPEVITVNVRARRFSMKEAAIFTPYWFLTDAEVNRIVIRWMNRLNKIVYGTAARRKKNPLRLPALICRHDKDTRSHIHALLGMPTGLSLQQIRLMLLDAARNEPFLYRVSNVERVENLPGSIIYNQNDWQSQTGMSRIYFHIPTTVEA